MKFNNKAIPHKRSLLCAAVSLSLLPLSGVSIAQDQSIEEENLGKYNFCHIDQSINQIDDTSFLNITDQNNDGTYLNNCVPLLQQ